MVIELTEHKGPRWSSNWNCMQTIVINIVNCAFRVRRHAITTPTIFFTDDREILYEDSFKLLLVIQGPRYSRLHDDVIKWKYFPRYWPFVRGIHRSQRPVTRNFDVFFDLRLKKTVE